MSAGKEPTHPFIKLGRSKLYLALEVVLLAVRTDMFCEFDQSTLLVQQLEPGALDGTFLSFDFIDCKLSHCRPVVTTQPAGIESRLTSRVDCEKILNVRESDRCQLLKDAICCDVKDVLRSLRDPLLQLSDPCRNLAALKHIDRPPVNRLAFAGACRIARRTVCGRGITVQGIVLRERFLLVCQSRLRHVQEQSMAKHARTPCSFYVLMILADCQPSVFEPLHVSTMAKFGNHGTRAL